MRCSRCESIIEKLQILYQGYFSEKINLCNSGILQDSIIFLCNHSKQSECNFLGKSQAFLTPFLGGCNGKGCDGTIMVVGEAPSGVNDYGLLIGGMFDDVGKNGNYFSVSNSHVDWIRDFVKEKYDVTPFFVDAIKCGAKRQEASKKELLDRRSKYCLQKFLSREIDIIDPNVILCMGGSAFDYAKEAILSNCLSRKEYKLVNLWHYSYTYFTGPHNYEVFKNKWEEQIKNIISVKSNASIGVDTSGDDLSEEITKAVIDISDANVAENTGVMDLMSFWREVMAKTKVQTGLKLISSIEENKVKNQLLYKKRDIKGLYFNYHLKAREWIVRLDIDFGADKERENALFFEKLRKEAVSIEKAFGHRLRWEQGKGRACKIVCPPGLGGYRTPEKLPTMQDEMVHVMSRLEKAVIPVIDRVNNR